MAHFANLLPFLLAAFLYAQDVAIRTNVPLVVVPVSVTGQNGHFVPNVSAEQFIVLDNGVAQTVRVEDPSDVTSPLDVVVLVQTSDISDSALLKIKKVGTMIQDAVAGANGNSAAITFSDQVQVVQEFSSDDNVLQPPSAS
jgi:hypothetical protein